MDNQLTWGFGVRENYKEILKKMPGKENIKMKRSSSRKILIQSRCSLFGNERCCII